MWSLIGGFVASVLGSSKASDTAIDAMRKLGGLNEMSDEQKAKYVLDYMSATRHQSPVRRFIALLTVGLWALCLIIWLLSAGIGYYGEFDSAINYAGQVKLFMTDTLATPANIIVGFYFVMGVTGKLK